jgi:CHAT domain-containing protein/tetratricopeptide (TPR) repeat protein
LGDLTGDAAVFRQAKAYYQDALLELSPESSPFEWATAQNNLGNTLYRLGVLTEEKECFESAQIALRNALEVRTKNGAPSECAATRANLGNVLQQLGTLEKDVEILEEAEQAYLSALQARDRKRDRFDWAVDQTNLGNVLRTIGDINGSVETLRRPETACDAALLELTQERALMKWAVAQSNLGNVLQSLWRATADVSALERAVTAYQLAFDSWSAVGADDDCQGLSGVLARLLLRLGRLEDAMTILEKALGLSSSVIANVQRSDEGRTRSVEQVSGLHDILAVCRLRQEQPDTCQAMVAAESGRARLLANALAVDAIDPSEITDPRARQAIVEAAEIRHALRLRLSYLTNRADNSLTGEGVAASLGDIRGSLLSELHVATESYLSLCHRHGLISAEPPMGFAEISLVAPALGAMVLPVLADDHAFAFIPADGAAEPTVIDLPRLNRQEVVAHLSGDGGWLGSYNSHFRDHQTKDALATERWRDQVVATMSWLWERLLEPIHVHLRDVAKLERNAEVVLLPPGLLGLLPLYAAGPGPDGLSFGDHWTVSDAPSVRALATCQDRARQRKNLPLRFLAALDPDGTLPGARAEAAMLKQRFGGKEKDPTILVGHEATLAAVTGRLSSTTCFHASTHGRHDSVQPARSGLKMSDGWLMLEDLRHARLDAARLVFLSACESGLAGVRKLPEEFIGLPAGFVQAGAACVIGSLWPIRDDASFLLAWRFYEEWLDEAGEERVKPALALRVALDWLRRVTFGELRKLFPIESGGDGVALILRDSDVMQLPDIEEIELEAPTKSREIRLPLGPDDERPYDHPEFWAAFACTGA